MSWLGGYKPKPPTDQASAPVDPREAKRQKLQAEREARAKQRENRQKQLQATIKARQEADQALKDFLNIDPDIFEGESSDSEISESILDDEEIAAEPIMADFADENGVDGEKALDNLRSVQCPFTKSMCLCVCMRI